MPSEEGSREKSCLIIQVDSVIEPCSPSNLLLLYVWLTFNHIISQKQASHNGIYYERVMHVFANNYLTNPYNLSSYIRNDPFYIWSPCLYLIIIDDFKAYIYGKNFSVSQSIWMINYYNLMKWQNVIEISITFQRNITIKVDIHVLQNLSQPY